MLKRIFLSLAILTFALSTSASEYLNGLDQFIRDAKNQTGMPSGTQIAVIKGDQIIFEGSYGYSDINKKEKVNAETVFYIASVTKPFFALMALSLENKQVVDTNDNLKRLFPDINPSLEHADKITVKNLLSHTAGVNNDALAWATAFSGIHDAQSRLALVNKTDNNTEHPFGQFDYTNVGYNICSVWLERKLKKPWQDLLQEEIFTPLQMTHTSAYISDSEKHQWTLAKPYSFASENQFDPLYLTKTDTTMQAAGGMLSTARDLAQMIKVQLNQGKLNGKTILPAKLIQHSQQKQATADTAYGDFKRDGYAWGWYTGKYKSYEFRHHFGGFSGFHPHVSFMPEQGIGVVILNNEAMLGSKLTGMIADYIYSALLEENNVDARLRQELAKLVEKTAQLNQHIINNREKMAQREWMLTLPQSAYSGIYRHVLLGDIVIAGDDATKVSWGSLAAKATPFPQQDTYRVELLPGSGHVIQFALNEKRVTGLTLDGMDFEKVN